ncbi:MAG TPA: hypothetical protein VLI39_04960 [Sedimentisphaerales bacterium]|nr:hypothetical protein [Sedimentisphaerales bacterium]
MPVKEEPQERREIEPKETKEDERRRQGGGESPFFRPSFVSFGYCSLILKL